MGHRGHGLNRDVPPLVQSQCRRLVWNPCSQWWTHPHAATLCCFTVESGLRGQTAYNWLPSILLSLGVLGWKWDSTSALCSGREMVIPSIQELVYLRAELLCFVTCHHTIIIHCYRYLIYCQELLTGIFLFYVRDSPYFSCGHDSCVF